MHFIDKDFFKGFIFIFVLGLFLVVGTSYSLEFFKVNKNGASIQFSTSAISINVTGDNTVNTTLSKYIDSEGLLNGLTKELTITNNNSSHGEAILKVERTSGVELSNLHYALIINNIVQKVDTVPSDGIIFDNVIMGNETLNVKVVLWVDNDYAGSDLTFNGTISSEIKRTYNLTSDILDDVIDFNNITTATNNYVSFNNEVYRIVKIEDGRIVICKNADFDSTAASRVNSNKFNTSLTYTDNSIIYSHSTDNKNLYLVKTVNIKSGKGTSTDPFILENNRSYLNDKKVSNYITYKDNNNTTLFTQPIYYGQDNYIMYAMNASNFNGWNDGTNTYQLGDTINFTSDTNLTALIRVITPVVVSNSCYSVDFGTSSYSYNYPSDPDEISACTTYLSNHYDTSGYTSDFAGRGYDECEDMAYYVYENDFATLLGDYISFDYANPPTMPLEDLEYFLSENIVSVTDGGDTSITGYDSSCGTAVAIPSQIAGSVITGIGEGAFSNLNLESVSIPNSVTTIGDGAFDENQITNLTLGNSVETIGELAFNANELTSVTIPNSVTTISDGAFRDNQLISVTIPNSVTTIGDYAFYGNNISSITLGNSVETIGDWAFSGYDDQYIESVRYNNITTLVIPNSVTSIGQSAFYGNNINSLTLGSSLETLGEDSFRTNQLTNVTIPNSVITIGNSAFLENQLTNLTLGNSVTTIDHFAFYDNKLTNVTIPSSVVDMPCDAFYLNGYHDEETDTYTELEITYENQSFTCTE